MIRVFYIEEWTTRIFTRTMRDTFEWYTSDWVEIINESSYYLINNMKVYSWTPDDGIIDINRLNDPGIHYFKGSINITNGPDNKDVLTDCSMLVTGETFGFRLLYDDDIIYIQRQSWNGESVHWKKIIPESLS